MPQLRSVVIQDSGVWVLRLEKSNGKVQEYRCTTEEQARHLAVLLELPAVAPPLPRPASA
jgi:hypothetical protein